MTVKYRIDNGGCCGAFVPGFGYKAYWDTIEEAADAAKILHDNSNRQFPYEIVSVDMDQRDGAFKLPKAIQVELVINED